MGSITVSFRGNFDPDIYDELRCVVNKLGRIKGVTECGGGVSSNNESYREFDVDNKLSQ